MRDKERRFEDALGVESAAVDGWLLRCREDDLGDDAECTLCTPRDAFGLIIAVAFGTAAGSGCNGGTLSLLLLLLLNDATALSL